MSEKKDIFVIIDGHALIHRAWHALPPLTNKEGTVVNAVYGFVTVLLKVLKEMKPTYIAVAFDRPEPTFRDKLYEPYKAQRKKQPDELYAQIPLIQDVLRAFHIPILEAPGFEADDVIGTVAHKIKKSIRQPADQEIKTKILTGDLDTLQLVDDQTTVVTFKKGLSETIEYDAAAVKEKLGVSPEQVIDYKALRGDASDNIPGVKGIGEKTAAQLIQDFHSLNNLYKEIKKSIRQPADQEITERIRTILSEHEKDAELSKKLVTIDCNAPVDFSLDDAEWKGYDQQAVYALFQKFDFKSLLGRLPEQKNAELGMQNAELPYRNIKTDDELKKVVEEAGKQEIIAVDTETDNLDPLRAKLVGISMSWKEGEAYYFDVRKGIPAELKTLLETEAPKKVGHNIKFDSEALATNGITLGGLMFDTMVASYILDASTRQHSLDRLVFQFFGHQMTPIKELIGTGKKEISMADVPLENIVPYACADADYTWRLYERFSKAIEKKGFSKLFEEMEMPLIPVLQSMETTGIKIDSDALNDLSKQLTKRLDALAKKIHDHAGVEFNIQSPKQMKEVLFEKMQLSTKGIGKTKTGISTAADQLEKLAEAHPIIPLIIEYRELSKLLSTYIDTLPTLVDKNDRIHTSFNQTVAATGRLSSSDPNLQNIPVRTELGNEIRKAFIADRGNVLLSADYSQIELRLAAHIADDPKMIQAFKDGEDIHQRTAAEVNGIALEAVTKEQRYAAKAINFGILYGMGPVSLGKQTGMSRDEAEAFIERYFLVYPRLREYIETTKALAYKRQFVETMFGRRRPVPEIRSRMPQVRAAAERMATNMPLQGSAADIMKMAMVKIHRIIESKKHGITRMLLQVHDELVFEVAKEDVKEVAESVKDIMEHIAKLKVPLVAEVKVGSNWGELKNYEL